MSSTEEAGRIDLLDSLASSMTLGRDLILQIAAIFQDDSAILKIHKMGVQQQSGMLDCQLPLHLKYVKVGCQYNLIRVKCVNTYTSV